MVSDSSTFVPFLVKISEIKLDFTTLTVFPLNDANVFTVTSFSLLDNTTICSLI